MDRRRTSLATRSNQLTLAGWASGQQEKSWKSLLDTEARAEDWRLVELFSSSGHPFEAELSWTSGSGAGGSAVVTVSRSTRVCVVARALRVRASNLTGAENRVSVNVAQPSGFVGTINVYEEPFTIPGEDALTLSIPPMTRRVRVEVADSAQAKTLIVQLLDGQGQLRSQVPSDEQPAEGLYLGGSDQLQLSNGHLSQVLGRVVFTLAL
jgi:hypothetical protein